MSMQTLNGRVAIVTGATAGIGEAIARMLLDAGARVVINGRRAERLDALVREFAGRGGDQLRAVGVAGDASDESTIAAMFSAARERFGARADLIVANAGRGLKGSATDSDTSQWEEMVRLNILGAAHLIRAAAKELTDGQGAGGVGTPRDIIVIGSIVGRHVSPFSSMYGATKFAVHGLTEGVRRELGPKGIRVSLVEPGFVTSEFQGVAGYAPEWYAGVVEKIGPVLRGEDVARVVRFIAEQPPHVHVGDVVVRPVRQEYP
jgi:NADP-dependent 3-hydroxy acid dehydrogenase YdfG